MNELILGDNPEVLRRLPAESVDLIYLDPPFFSNRTYEVIWGPWRKWPGLRTKEGICIELVRVEDVVPLAHKPRLTVAVAALVPAGSGGKRAVQLTATGHSPAGFEFYAWDAHHDATQGFCLTVLLDKAGQQTLHLRPVPTPWPCR